MKSMRATASRPFSLSMTCAALGAVLLAGCDSAVFDDSMRHAVRATLKDPDSAKFGEVIKYNGFGCLKYNARNGYGGYAGESWAVLEMAANGWRVVDADTRSCDLDTLRAMVQRVEARAAEDKVKAEENAEGMIRAVFIARGMLPRDAQYLHQLPAGPCRDRAYSVMETAKKANNAKEKQIREAALRQFDQEVFELTTFPCS